MRLNGKRVFLVEDDVLLLMSLQDMVCGFGCVIADHAMAVEPALEIAREVLIDLAVLDVNLKGQLVTPVADLLARRAIPFVFATGYDSEILPAMSDRPRVRKPYTADQIRTAMVAALA